VREAAAECERLAKRRDVPKLEDTSEVSKGSASLDALRAAALADFENDEPLIIYSDALQQAGDPRGEFISLQLAPRKPATEKRERELFKAHAREWISPLDVAVRPDSIRFERGFLHACRVEGGTQAEMDKLKTHPLWSTVRELDCDDMTFATQPIFAGLQRGTFTASALDVLARRDAPLPLEGVISTPQMTYGLRLRFGMPLATPAAWGATLDVGALTSLRSLQLRGARGGPSPEDLRWLLDSKLGMQLREVDFFGDLRLASWLPELRRRGPGFLFRCRFSNANTAAGDTAILATWDTTRVDDGFELGITFNNEMVDLRFLSMPEQIAGFLAGVTPADKVRARVRYNGSRKRTTMGFPAIATTLSQAFEEIVLE